jgi:hypothetical protein
MRSGDLVERAALEHAEVDLPQVLAKHRLESMRGRHRRGGRHGPAQRARVHGIDPHLSEMISDASSVHLTVVRQRNVERSVTQPLRPPRRFGVPDQEERGYRETGHR